MVAEPGAADAPWRLIHPTSDRSAPRAGGRPHPPRHSRGESVAPRRL